jgi:hypothetical protein
MGDGEIPFVELPTVDDVAVEDEYVGGDAFEVVHQFLGAASVSSKVYIREYDYIYRSFFHCGGFPKVYIRYYSCIKPVLTNCEFYVNPVLPGMDTIPLRP